MSNQSQFQTLFAYQWYTLKRLIECAGKLSEDDYRANPGYGHGSIHDLLFHLLNAGCSWRVALETGTQPAPLDPQNFGNLKSMQAAFANEEGAWSTLLAKLNDEQIQGDIALTTRRGNTQAMPYWRILQHLVLHGMQHHTELAQLLTLKGQTPGNIDFIFYA